MNSYEIILYSPNRNAQRLSAGDIHTLDYVLNENAGGAATLVIPSAILPRTFFAEGVQMEVWRTSANGIPVMDGGSQWFMEKFTEVYDAEGLYIVEFADGMSLLARRNVMYKAGSKRTNKTGPADDVMKSIVYENLLPVDGIFGSFTFNDRIVKIGGFMPDVFQVQANISALPRMTKGFSWANVLTTLQSLANASFSAGVYASFRMIQIDGATGKLEFRTYAGGYGADRRASLDGLGQRNGILLTPENGSVASANVIHDWSTSATAVVAGGQGDEELRAVGWREVTPTSPWGFRDYFAEKTDTADLRELNTYAAGQLQIRLPKRRITANIQTTDAIQYGRDFGISFEVTAQIGTYIVDARVNQVAVNLAQETGETITASIVSEESILPEGALF